MSDAAQPVNQANLFALLRKMHFIGGFDCEDMPPKRSILTVENNTLCAFERSKPKGRIPNPKPSSKIELFSVEEGDMFVVFRLNGDLKVARLDESHVSNRVFQPNLHDSVEDGQVHRAYEFNMHLHDMNHPALLDPHLLQANVETACERLALEIWDGQDPSVIVEPNVPKYSGFGFNITIISHHSNAFSDLCFPERALKKHLAFQVGMPDAEPSMEIFNVTVV